MDLISIESLVVSANIGVTPDERRSKQNLAINILVRADLSAACKSDSIKDTINYAQIKKEAFRIAETQKFCLLETLGANLAEWVLCQFPQAKEVTVTVKKISIWLVGIPGVSIVRKRRRK
jgi:dihydroneopterin aldolase